ncbi:hypothetical protein J4Q44_G00324050 [Coregonus suidteri]|uniref:Uncharacterized protein n=1 Tax=Coregonus suidteri TaxID=861788 RepID=A0AAN8KUQ1_9TELE
MFVSHSALRCISIHALRLGRQLPHSRALPDTDQDLNGLTQRLLVSKPSYIRFKNYTDTHYITSDFGPNTVSKTLLHHW